MVIVMKLRATKPSHTRDCVKRRRMFRDGSGRQTITQRRDTRRASLVAALRQAWQAKAAHP